MQFLFDMKIPKATSVGEAKVQNQRLMLRRGVIKWLYESGRYGHPAVSVDVPVRGSILRVDVGAVTYKNRRVKLENGQSMTMQIPEHSIGVLVFPQREDCWPECDHAEKILTEIAKLKSERAELEAQIRVKEPELRDTNMLFEEYAVWDYDKSSNEDYHKVMKHLGRLEMSLFHGTRLARICTTQTLNEVILAVPPDILGPSEVMENWGLLEIDPETLEGMLCKEPKSVETSAEQTQNFAVNLALASTKHVVDCHGLRVNDDDGSVDVLKMPRFRHKAIIKKQEKKQ